MFWVQSTAVCEIVMNALSDHLNKHMREFLYADI